MKNITSLLFTRCKSVVLWVMALVFSVSIAQNPYTIQFQDQTIEMPENISTFQWSEMPQSSRLDNGYIGWVQFYETPNQATQDFFKTNGLQLISYIPHRTYLFHFPENTSISLLQQSGVRSIVPVSNNVKISSSLRFTPYESWAMEGDNVLVTVIHHEMMNNQAVVRDLVSQGYTIKQQYENSNHIELAIPTNSIESIASLPYIKWVELITPPSVKDDTRGRSLHRANGLDTQTDTGRNYTGNGIGVMTRDDGAVGPHIDFEGRISGLVGNNGSSTHGDGVSGIMAGAGNRNPANRGMAAEASLLVVNYNSSFLDSPTTTNINSGTSVITNSSYSNGCNDGYTSTTVTVDTQMNTLPNLLHVFSAGNSNNSNCGYGAGNQWGNITGGHKQGKNVIATANVFFDGSLVSSSSRGPAHDGRIKPDISANGQNQISTAPDHGYLTFGGTSGAAPGIAGISAQLYQAYSEANGGDLPDGSLIKAVLLNTANDAGNVGPDFKFGWGIVNALRAGILIEEGRHLSDNVTQGGSNTHTINVPAGTAQVRFMVHWNDPAATVGASPALVNDLDLTVTDPSSNVLEPWILDSTPNPTALDTPATTGVDRLNNVEQVLINAPAAGNYDVTIDGFNVPVGPQEYFVVYEIISENLTVTYPNGGEHFFPNVPESIHWDAIDTTDDYVVDYSTDNGATWTNIATVPNGTTTVAWTAVNENTGQGLIRVTSGAYQDVSDANFDIARYTNVINITKVCETEATFTCLDVADAEFYDWYRLGATSMELIGTSTTASIVVPISDPDDEMWIAMSARNDTEGWESRRSNAKFYEGGLLDCVLGLDDNALSSAVTVYPNPASTEVFVSLNDSTFENFEVKLTNSLGQVLQTINTKDLNGSNNTSINVSSYARGLYFVTITAGESATTKKLLIK